MTTKYPMPQWGVTMEEGTIAEWLVPPGQKVGEGETVSCGTNVIVIAADASDVASFAAHG